MGAGVVGFDVGTCVVDLEVIGFDVGLEVGLHVGQKVFCGNSHSAPANLNLLKNLEFA